MPFSSFLAARGRGHRGLGVLLGFVFLRFGMAVLVGGCWQVRYH